MSSPKPFAGDMMKKQFMEHKSQSLSELLSSLEYICTILDLWKAKYKTRICISQNKNADWVAAISSLRENLREDWEKLLV